MSWSVEVLYQNKGIITMDRLQLLVFSFYREDPLVAKVLEPLKACRMTRTLGIIAIDCLDLVHLKQIGGLLRHLRPPFVALGMGRQIVLREPGSIQRTYSMQTPSSTDLFA